MYIVLNYKLILKNENNKSNYYEISMDKDKEIISTSYDVVKLSKIVRENYSLGEDIHVYCIDEYSFEQKTNEIQNKNIYKFKVKAEVGFKDLKSTSRLYSKNDFMVYKFCSNIEKLIFQKEWDKCLAGLVESLDFKTLLDIAIYLKNLPKNQNNISLINDAIDKIEEKALLKSFETNSVKVDDLIKLLDGSYKNELLVISRLKNHIYSGYTDLDVLNNEVNILSELSNKNIFKHLSEDYADKLILIYSSCNNINSEKKEIFKKCESTFNKIVIFLEENQFDSSKIKEKYEFLMKQKKRLLF